MDLNAEEFIAAEERKVIENLWSGRNAFTIHDTDWLADLKVSYGDACGLESNCPLDAQHFCLGCGWPADKSGYCPSRRLYGECEPKSWDDVKFLRECGIKPIAI
jgi:hypothetical protein